jgi:hypothetical protein
MRHGTLVTLAVLASLWLATGWPPVVGAAAPLVSWVDTDHLPVVVGLLASLIVLALGGGTPEHR